MVYYTIVRRAEDTRAAKDAARAAGLSLLLPLLDLPSDTPLMKTESGCPYLKGAPGVHLSLSHAFPFTVVAVSDRPVGVDVENERGIRDPERLANRFFTEAEQDAVSSSTDPKLTTLAIWTRKEAVGKYYGDGLAAYLTTCTSTPPVETAFHEEHLSHNGFRYILTTCAHECPIFVPSVEE